MRLEATRLHLKQARDLVLKSRVSVCSAQVVMRLCILYIEYMRLCILYTD